MTLDEQARELEEALEQGRVTILGERSAPSASKAFLERLEGLSPSVRKLAIARACVAPWVDSAESIPACFQWELTRATEEVSADCHSLVEINTLLDALFATHISPISGSLLREVTQLTPTRRYFALIFAFASAWKPQERPDWLKRELAYAKWLASDEYRAWGELGWTD